MSFGNQKIAINLREAEKDNALIETLSDGKEKIYYPKKFATRWNCEKLQVNQAFAYREESDQNPPRLETFITGTARLVSDYDVSVIGEPENKTVAVEISFRPNDSPDLLAVREHENQNSNIRLSGGPYGRAHMGFNRADWEIRSKDNWWLECYLHSTTLQPLISAISSGVLDKVSLSVELRNFYTDEPPYVPFHDKAHLFLRPNKSDNTINNPEVAHGWLEGIWLKLEGVELSQRKQEFVQEEPEQSLTDTVPDPAIQASQLVSERIESLRRTMKWVLILISAALLLQLFK